MRKEIRARIQEQEGKMYREGSYADGVLNLCRVRASSSLLYFCNKEPIQSVAVIIVGFLDIRVGDQKNDALMSFGCQN
jgi:hypothetical protein